MAWNTETWVSTIFVVFTTPVSKRIMSGLKFMFLRGLKYVHFLIEGYSDLIVIPKDNLKLFCHLCGIFAAMNCGGYSFATSGTFLWVNHPRTRSRFDGKGVLEPHRCKKGDFQSRRKNRQDKWLFSEDTSYIHPIKLSEFSWAKKQNTVVLTTINHRTRRLENGQKQAETK